MAIGFTAKWDGDIIPPQNYETLIAQQEVEETDYTIKFKVTSDWGKAFNGEISITNNTEETIEDWMLEFDFDRTIERFWTAEIVEHTGEHYIIKNAGYNANIKPGETIKLGFAGNPGNVDSEPENYVLEQVGMEIDYEKDSDGDDLPDWFEKEIGTNPQKADTDGDGLPDGYEYYALGIDPLKKDTDGNGIDDGDEDFDEDGLTNTEEYELGTDPHNKDTDFDGLTDGDKVYVYRTDPLKVDADDDGLEDGDEILVGYDPFNPDTDGNGILDGKEKIYQIYEEIITEQEKPEITKVTVAFEGNGNLQKTTYIENMYNIDILSTDVVGLVGVPVEINTTSEFDAATITFHYDKTLLGDVAEDDLCIMWYDKANQWYEILDEESVIDKENNTVSVKTNHFSTYLVVNRQDWYKAWSTSLDYRTSANHHIPVSSYDIALVLDSSGSMGGTPIVNAKYAARSFVNAMYSNDRIGIITFNSSAQIIANMTYAKNDTKKEELKELINTKITASGGTATNTGLNKALEMLQDNSTLNKKIIVLLCDGDGLPDVFEVIGMQLINGKIVTSDPTKKDTDNDGLTDYKEMGSYIKDKKVYLGNGKYAYKIHFRGKSDPGKKDSDGDGHDDKKDKRPLQCDVFETKLNDREEFIPIKDGAKTYYGGNQEWFDFTVGKYGGCGTVAGANLSAYMSQQPKYSYLYNRNPFFITKKDFTDHMNEVFEYLPTKKLPFINKNANPFKVGPVEFGWTLGIWPLNSFVSGFEKYGKSKGVDLKAVYANPSRFTKENAIKYIKEGLSKDKPVALLIGLNSQVKGVITYPTYTGEDMETYT